MLDQGPLRIALSRPGGRGGRLHAEVAAPPPLPVARLLLGQTPEAAARRAGLMLAVCGAAQAGAVRAACGLPPEPGAGRRILHETLRDHALKLAVAWPAALGLPPDPAGPAGVAHLPRDGGAALGRALFGPGGLPAGLPGFLAWLDAGAAAPARVLAQVWHAWPDAWGRVELPLWAPEHATPEEDWPDTLRAEWHGGAIETGLTALHAAAPLLQAIAAERGRGLVWRLAARLVDAAAALAALRGEAPEPVPVTLAPGLGAARAARGTLLVRAAVAAGRVVQLDRLSPTDAALHPDGLLRRLLATLPPEPDAPLPAVAALVLEAADLCLPHALILADESQPEETPHVHGLRLFG